MSVTLVVPTAPAATGNGLAMRAGLLLESLAATEEVDLVVVPISGPASLSPWASAQVRRAVTVDLPDDPASARAHTTGQLADRLLRERVARSQPLPDRVRRVPPTLAGAIADDLGADAVRSTVVAMREYLVPLGAWLARRLESRRLVFDLDDDAVAVLRQLGHHDEAEGYGRLAREWFGDADVRTAASDDEAAAMTERYGHRVDVLPNAVRLPGPAAPRPGHDRLLLVGNLTYEPNVEAARELVDAVLPAVRRRRPDATLTLVGRHDARLAPLQARDGVTVTGHVDEVTSAYAGADLVVVPMRSGAGTRIKVLEALAHGRPVVGTPVAVAGLGLRDGHDVVVADDPSELASAVADLLADDDRWRALATAGLATVARTHTVDAVAPRVRRLVLGSPDVPPARRPAT